MRDPFFFGVGGVVSADIAVPEHERELRFYSQILTTGRVPLWRDDLMNNQGTPVIGLGVRGPEYESLPLQWMPHFQVSDVAASAAQAIELGGQELMHGRGDDGQSQWAVLADPAGAAFGVIPAVMAESNATTDLESIGRIAWLSLVAPDVSSRRAFYEKVVGWSAGAADAAGRLEMRGPDGVAAAEICPVTGDDQSIPSVWLLCLPVGDLEESLRRVRKGGGEIIQDAIGARHAVIRDPIGVYLALQANRRA